MTNVISDLADVIKMALGPPLDNSGNPIATTMAMTQYATAVINTIKAASFANAPGTITGAGAPGAPLEGGLGAGGLFVGLTTATWLAALTAGFPTAPSANLQLEATASVGYLQASGFIVFAAGSITGECTATPVSPGILAAGAGAGGMLTGLVGSAWAAAVLAALGTPGPLAAPVYTAIAGYLMANTVCTYPAGTVTGTFAPGGGALAAGAGAGGSLA